MRVRDLYRENWTHEMSFCRGEKEKSGVKLGESKTHTSSRLTQRNYSIIKFYLVHKGTTQFIVFFYSQQKDPNLTPGSTFM